MWSNLFPFGFSNVLHATIVINASGEFNLYHVNEHSNEEVQEADDILK